MDRKQRHNLLLEFLQQLSFEDGVYRPAEAVAFENFEEKYIRSRQVENRILPDEAVAKLPDATGTEHAVEWVKRKKSAGRIIRYLEQVEESLILDLGCGNGWFTNLMSNNKNITAIGLDVNLTELKQAARIFRKENLFFLYGDIFELKIPTDIFDFVTVNAAVQYFPDFNMLIKRLFELLAIDGEIHIIDSPFYSQNEIEAARERTTSYYEKTGNPAMAAFYHHHSREELEKYNFDLLYDPTKNRWIKKLTGKADMPFPWIRIKKERR